MRSGGKKSGVVAPLYDVLLFACLMSWQKPPPLVPAVGFKPPCLRTESAGANCVRSLLISRTLGPHRLTVGRHGRASSYWTQEPQARTGCDQGGGAASVDVARPDLALPARTGLGLQRVRFEHIRHAANTNGWGERSQEAGCCRWHCLRLETDLARDRRRVSRRCGLHLTPEGFHADACFRSLRPLCFRLHQTWRSAIAASVLLHATSERHRCVCSRLVLPFRGDKRFPLSREWYLTGLMCILFQKRPCCPTAAPKERTRFARGGHPDREGGRSISTAMLESAQAPGRGCHRSPSPSTPECRAWIQGIIRPQRFGGGQIFVRRDGLRLTWYGCTLLALGAAPDSLPFSLAYGTHPTGEEAPPGHAFVPPGCL